MTDNTPCRESWAAIFDLDGTMVDNRVFHQKAWIEMGRRHGLPITAELYQQRIHSRGNDVIVNELFGGHLDADNVRRMSEEKESVYRELYRPHVREVPGLSALLSALNVQDVPCGVASNSPRVNVDFVLDRLGLQDYFQFTLAVDEVTAGKPDPELLLKTADALNVPPTRCIVLEDSVSGFKSAEQAGMSFIIIEAGADPACVELHRKQAAAVKRDFVQLTPNGMEQYLARTESAPSRPQRSEQTATP